jgi:hypothetical protein
MRSSRSPLGVPPSDFILVDDPPRRRNAGAQVTIERRAYYARAGPARALF